MRGIKSIIIHTLLFFTACSVDYSVLEDRFCNSKNECIEGYRCDLNTRKCIKSETQSDVYYSDAKYPDVKTMDIKHYDIESEIVDHYAEDIYDTANEDDIIEIKDYFIEDTAIDGGICEEGTFVCKENDLYKCNSNNEFEFEKSCELGCKKDHCMECLPNEKRCADENHLNICSEEGLFSTEECAYKCYNDQCAICLPSDKYCKDKTAVYCNQIGTEWKSTDCEIGCSAGECMICTPEVEKKCVDNDIHICSSTGMEFIPLKNCCHDNNCKDGECVNTSPRVIDYNPKDWKVGSTVYCDIVGCFFVPNATKVFIDFGGSWKEITDYNNYSYTLRTDSRIQIKVDVLTGTEFNFKVVNPDGQESPKYPIKKHY